MVASGEATAALAAPDGGATLTEELVRVHLEAYRRRGSTAVALRDARSGLELGAWRATSAQASSIARIATDLARGQPDTTVQLAFKLEDGSLETLHYAVKPPEPAPSELDVLRAALRESHEHIRETHALLAKMTATQLGTLTRFWEFARLVQSEGQEERAMLLQQLMEARSENEQGGQAMQLLQAALPILGPQVGALVSAAAERLRDAPEK